MPLDRVLARLRQRITPTRRAAFLACFIAGYLIHLFAFTNIIPNSDGLSRVFDPQQMTVSGRWFLHYASFLNDFTQMPALIGFFSMVFLALAAAQPGPVRLCRGAHGRLPLSGVHLPLHVHRLRLLPGHPAGCAGGMSGEKGGMAPDPGGSGSAGPGHGDLPGLRGGGGGPVPAGGAARLPPLPLHPEGDRPAGLPAGGLSGRGGRPLLRHPPDFPGGERPGTAGLPGHERRRERLPRRLSAYKQVFVFFFWPNGSNSFTTPLLAGLDLLALALAVACFLAIVFRRALWREPWRLIGALVLAALLPLAVGFAQIIAPFSDATPIMKYAYVLVYMAVLLTADLGLSFLPRPRGGMAVSGVLALCLAGVTLYSANINNLLYTAADQAHRATLSYATRLLTRIESCPGYTGEEEVLIIGAFPTDRIYADIESYALVDHYSVPRDTVAPLNKHIYYYFNDWLNVPIAEPGEETMIAVAQSEEFQAMPLYPADGSVRMLDGRVVVKIQEEYTPKSDYELAYENRR